MSEITALPLEPIQATRPAQSTLYRTQVKLDRPPLERQITLSCIDQIAPRVYNYAIHPFRLRKNPPKAEIFRTLAQGLQQALAEFPEFAGKIVPVDSPRDGLGIEVDDHGVMFQMVDCTLPENAAVWPFGTFRDLSRSHFAITGFPPEVFCPQEVDNNEAGLRCMYAQVTFVEGGMILSYTYHHVASDGPGGNHLVKSWARHTNVASQSEIIPIRSKPEHAFRRSPLDSTGVEGVRLLDFPHWKVANEGAALDGAIVTRSVGLTGVSQSAVEDPAAKRPGVNTWHLSTEKLKQLKADIAGDRGRIGTNEALCALIWRHVSLARRLDQSDYETSVLSTPCDARRAMGLHPEYAGNACEPNAYTRMSVRRVCSEGYQTLWELAQEVRNQIKRVDGVAVRRLIGLLKTMPSATHLTWNCDRWPGPDMLISTLLEAGWTDMDWGMLMGRSVVGRFLVGPDSPVDGRVFILPRSQDKQGIEVMIRYPQDVLDRLAQDAIWRKYFELWED